MECEISWLGERTFIAKTGSGHLVPMDGAPEAGGRNLAGRPMEMLLVGLGGCSAFDVVMILEKSRQPIADCKINITAKRAESDPKIFTQIHMHYQIICESGKKITNEVVERAIKLSAEKYCSASAVIGATAIITHDFEVL